MPLSPKKQMQQIIEQSISMNDLHTAYEALIIYRKAFANDDFTDAHKFLLRSRVNLCIDRRCACIVGLLLSGLFAAKCSFADVCLNKWTDLCKVLVGIWFDR